MESVRPIDMHRHPDEPRPREGERGREAAAGLLASIGLHLLAAVMVLGAVRAEHADRPLRAIEIGLMPPATVTAGRMPRPALPAPAAAVARRTAAPRSAPSSAPSSAPPSARPPDREVRAASTTPVRLLPETAPSPAAPGPAADASTETSAPVERAVGSALALPLPAPTAPAAGNGPGSTGAFGTGVAPISPAAGGGTEAPGYGSIPGAIQRGVAYPALARKMGWEGRVLVSFRILPDGSVRDIRVIQGSGYAILDRNAVEAVRSASPFPRPPEATEIQTPVVYKLY